MSKLNYTFSYFIVIKVTDVMYEQIYLLQHKKFTKHPVYYDIVLSRDLYLYINHYNTVLHDNM
jgi:hypothetical protein